MIRKVVGFNSIFIICLLAFLPVGVVAVTTTIQPSSKDSQILSDWPDTNYGSDTWMCVCNLARRSLVQFDLSSIPSGSKISSATLKIYYGFWATNNPSGRTYWAYRVTQSWTEGGVTWNKHDGTNNWATQGGDYTTTDGDSATVPGSSDSWMMWNATAIVKAWIEDDEPNYGFLIRDGDETGATTYFAYFRTREFTDPDLHPILTINHTRALRELKNNVLNAPSDSVYFVPTGNIYDDSALYSIYAYRTNPQVITSPTQSPTSSAFLNPDGSPLFEGDIVTFGGRFANRLVAYYEDAGLAKISFVNNGTHRIFRRISDGSHVYAVDSSTYNSTEKDYFVFQAYTDEDRYIFSEWGINAEGTYAGGVCFIDHIWPNIENYDKSYYVFSWTDVNADGMSQREEITLETSGI